MKTILMGLPGLKSGAICVDKYYAYPVLVFLFLQRKTFIYVVCQEFSRMANTVLSL